MKYNIEFVKGKNVWFSFSGLLIVVGLVAAALNWMNPDIGSPLKWGIDFKGGTEIRVVMPADFTVDAAAKALGELGLKRETLKRSENELIISVEKADQNLRSDVERLLAPEFKVSQNDISVDMVGPTIGKELQRSALLALTLGLLGILLYVTMRYDFKFAVSSIAALFHDVLVLIGFFAITRMDVNSYFVPALLTVVGYSINDTIVIFDRIRENLKQDKKSEFGELVNRSINETLTRSINTVLTTLLTITAVLVFGGPNIRPFALALVVGITSGCYSSIFNASQILVWWKERNLAARNKVTANIGNGRMSAPSIPVAVTAGALSDGDLPERAEGAARAKPAGTTKKKKTTNRKRR